MDMSSTTNIETDTKMCCCGGKISGYLAAQQSFLDNTDVLLLIPNLLKKDLASASTQEAGMALDCLANIMTPDLARDLVADVFSLLNRYVYGHH